MTNYINFPVIVNSGSLKMFTILSLELLPKNFQTRKSFHWVVCWKFYRPVWEIRRKVASIVCRFMIDSCWKRSGWSRGLRRIDEIRGVSDNLLTRTPHNAVSTAVADKIQRCLNLFYDVIGLCNKNWIELNLFRYASHIRDFFFCEHFSVLLCESIKNRAFGNFWKA